mmetsp:Transcript_17976/g.42840  ORF Transcript_17976/g.42840 Transcript_17976/m.42840 type:complete len:286 (-) Transcript_17976:461-1318(-)
MQTSTPFSPPPGLTPLSDVELYDRFAGVVDACGSVTTWPADERELLRQFIIHAADLGHAFKPTAASKDNVRRLLSEFFAQGDKEKALDLPISFDRHSFDIAKGQIAFFDFAMAPTFAVIAKLLPETQVLADAVMANLSFWKDVEAGTATFHQVDTPYTIPEVYPVSSPHYKQDSSPVLDPVRQNTLVRRRRSGHSSSNPSTPIMIRPALSPSALSPRAGSPRTPVGNVGEGWDPFADAPGSAKKGVPDNTQSGEGKPTTPTEAFTATDKGADTNVTQLGQSSPVQ